MFMKGLLGGRQSAAEHGVLAMRYPKDPAMTFVDYHDVAEAAVIAFTTDDLVNGTFELAAGGMVTRTELAALMTRYARREVTAQDADPGTALRGVPDGSLRDGLLATFADHTAHRFHGGNSLALRTIPGRPRAR
jgi:uncharacterized protein YbjT (DUF2867 family)